MRLDVAGRPHLTYCTNVHAGEGAQDVVNHVGKHVVEVKRRLGARHPFGVGLRVSAAAAEQLLEPTVLTGLQQLLSDNGLYVFSLNGFPYGAFHRGPVKERVYEPDWKTDARQRYTESLALLLSRLLPEGVGGSISTVPGGFRSARGAEPEIAFRLVQTAARLFRLYEESGRSVELALEPEPACFLETTAEAVQFFEDYLFASAAVRAFAAATGLGPGDAEEALRRHLGICFDACHAAVQFEDPRQSLASLARAGIHVGKVQLSAGLSVRPGTDEVDERGLRNALLPFCDAVYLHQVVEQEGDSYRRFVDLPDALSDAARRSRGEWRIHFHVPIFRAELTPFRSTQPFLRDTLRFLVETGGTRHWEVETYTWEVLPSPFRAACVEEAIARELGWVLDEVGGGSSLARHEAHR